jgi:chemotaxis protein CheD
MRHLVLADRPTTVKVAPGDHYVTAQEDVVIVTVLGSCVAACIRDPLAGVGGMNHFMLPSSRTGAWGDATGSLRYGNFAMERLINEILIRGGRRERLEIKLFGGGNVLGGATSVGHSNADFVEWYLRSESMPIAASNLRGTTARQVRYFPVTGKALVKHLEIRQSRHTLEEESAYGKSLVNAPSEADIELFS